MITEVRKRRLTKILLFLPSTCRRIINNDPPYPKYFSEDMVSLLRKLLVKDPKHRLGNSADDADAIKQHRFFKVCQSMCALVCMLTVVCCSLACVCVCVCVCVCCVCVCV